MIHTFTRVNCWSGESFRFALGGKLIATENDNKVVGMKITYQIQARILGLPQ